MTLRDRQLWYYRGDAWESKGEFDKAIADFTDAIRLCPFEAFERRRRGDAWQAKGELDKAIEDYDEAIRLDPELQRRVPDAEATPGYPRTNSKRQSPITRS